MTHEEIQADLSLFALGSLDSEERRQIEKHLSTGCASCRRELQNWNDVLGSVALTEIERPAPQLRERLLERARTTKKPKARVIQLPRWTLLPVVAAAALAIMIGRKFQQDLSAELQQQSETVAALNLQLNQLQRNFLIVKEQLAGRERDVEELRAALASAEQTLAIVQKPGLQLVRLQKTPEAPSAEAHVLVAASAGRALFYAFDLPPAPEGKTYELWWITEKQGPINAGLFVPDERGLGRVETQLPKDAGAIQAAAVTIEPAGGVDKPTGPMVLLGNVNAAL